MIKDVKTNTKPAQGAKSDAANMAKTETTRRTHSRVLLKHNNDAELMIYLLGVRGASTLPTTTH